MGIRGSRKVHEDNRSIAVTEMEKGRVKEGWLSYRSARLEKELCGIAR